MASEELDGVLKHKLPVRSVLQWVGYGDFRR